MDDRAEGEEWRADEGVARCDRLKSATSTVPIKKPAVFVCSFFSTVVCDDSVAVADDPQGVIAGAILSASL